MRVLRAVFQQLRSEAAVGHVNVKPPLPHSFVKGDIIPLGLSQQLVAERRWDDKVTYERLLWEQEAKKGRVPIILLGIEAHLGNITKPVHGTQVIFRNTMGGDRKLGIAVREKVGNKAVGWIRLKAPQFGDIQRRIKKLKEMKMVSLGGIVEGPVESYVWGAKGTEVWEAWVKLNDEAETSKE
ncbi:hypothetical protein EX30DRAFT_362219 [Ascodesmis nigricans]|uniref:Uncharacterized protein n=1 Tax=Ascodesmis nigricans TaxID=341454 RepID=A0A4S2N5H2_9PEZI|nr:hypothetical protein EX30DRAFT_362219 [Ascodesmis nigricans]